MGDGTERLRGQLREAAQRGQASDYGGDQIEDTAAGGANRAVYGMEILLKKKRAAKGWMPEEKTYHEIDLPMQGPAAEPSLEAPARPPSLHEPPPREQPQIKTREAVFAIEDGTGTVPSESSRARLSPGEQMRETRIKTRESAVHDLHLDGPPARQTLQELPQIRTMAQAKPGLPQIGSQDTIASASTAQRAAAVSTGMEMPPERLAIKTKNTYIQRQAAMDSTQPSQTFSQGQQKFMRERSRNAAIKRNEVQRTGCSPHAQGKAPPRRGYVGGQTKHAPAQAVRGAARSGDPAFRPVRDGGQTAVKTARSGKKTVERTAKQTIKTVERSSRQAIKTTQRTAKTVQHTVKTAQISAQAAVKATQRAIQAARATAKAVAITAKVAAKVTVAAIKAAIAAIQALIAAIGAGGWVVLVIVLLICIVGLLIASPYGIFFSDSGSPDAVSPPEAIAQINREYSDTLSLLQAGGTYDRVEIQGRPPSWADVFAVFAVKTAGGTDGASVAVLNPDTVEKLRMVFWDMTKITTEETDIEHPAEGDTPAWMERVLTITVTPRTPDDMRVFYLFTDQQNAALDELLAEEIRVMWNGLLYGSSGEIVAVALSQVGNVGGQPYWSWYGFNSRVEWCACFVSWCADQCGYIDAGVIPKFSSCTIGSNWFKARGQWQDGSYEPRPGDLIFFDWDNRGSSGPQDDVPDHVGIVERVENGVVYTVEGNSGDRCRQNDYSVGHYEIWGYATPVYN